MNLDLLFTIVLMMNVSEVIGFMIYATRKKSTRQRYFWVGIMLAITAVVDCSTSAIYLIFRVNPNILGGIYLITKLPIYLMIYRTELKSIILRRIIAILIPISFLLACYEYGFFHGPQVIASYTETVCAAVLIIISMLYFFQLLREQQKNTIAKVPMFWINSAVIIYHTGTFSIALSTEYMVEVLKSDMLAPWIFMSTLGVIYYITIGWAFTLDKSENVSIQHI